MNTSLGERLWKMATLILSTTLCLTIKVSTSFNWEWNQIFSVPSIRITLLTVFISTAHTFEVLDQLHTWWNIRWKSLQHTKTSLTGIMGKVIMMQLSTHPQNKKYYNLLHFLRRHLYNQSLLGYFALGWRWIVVGCHFYLK